MVKADAKIRYVIFEKASDTNREYIYQIGRSSAYTSEDIGNAIEFYDMETVLTVKEHILKMYSNRSINKELYVLSISTNYEVI